MKFLFLILVPTSMLFTGTAMIHHGDQVDSAPQEQTRPFMRAKLVSSQRVLDGLVSEDFSLIHRGAEHMKQMSEALQWPQSDDQVYEHYSQEFRRQCDKLMQMAKAKDLEVAHYTYQHMTTTCINCHNYVRGKFRVEPNSDNLQGPVRLIPTEWEGSTYQHDRSAESSRKRRN